MDGVKAQMENGMELSKETKEYSDFLKTLVPEEHHAYLDAVLLLHYQEGEIAGVAGMTEILKRQGLVA